MNILAKIKTNPKTTIAVILIAIGEYGQQMSFLPEKWIAAAKILGYIGLAIHSNDAK